MPIKCIAFDCFGTVFDASTLPKDAIRSYVEHVNRNDFSEFAFSPEWYYLEAHTDSKPGINALRSAGFKCVALSNGSFSLISALSAHALIRWDHIVDLAAHRVYKPHVDAYRTIYKDLGYKPAETLMVTANPTFGDIEGAAAIGMRSVVIRNGDPKDIIALYQQITAPPQEQSDDMQPNTA